VWEDNGSKGKQEIHQIVKDNKTPYECPNIVKKGVEVKKLDGFKFSVWM